MCVCKQGGTPGAPLVNKVNFSEGEIKADGAFWVFFGGERGDRRDSQSRRRGHWRDREGGRGRGVTGQGGGDGQSHGGKVSRLPGTRPGSGLQRQSRLITAASGGQPGKRPLTHGHGVLRQEQGFGGGKKPESDNSKPAAPRGPGWEPCPLSPPARLGAGTAGKGNTKAIDRPCSSLLTLPRWGRPGALWPELLPHPRAALPGTASMAAPCS